MRIVIALGDSALLRRDPMTTEVQRRNIVVTARAIARMATEHSVVIGHVGYMIQQALRSFLRPPAQAAIVAGKAGTNVVTSLAAGPGRERGSEAWR
jgi:hypothetical protein